MSVFDLDILTEQSAPKVQESQINHYDHHNNMKVNELL